MLRMKTSEPTVMLAKHAKVSSTVIKNQTSSFILTDEYQQTSGDKNSFKLLRIIKDLLLTVLVISISHINKVSNDSDDDTMVGSRDRIWHMTGR